MNQSTALQILKSGRNVFLTGSAGTGKTYLLNQFIDEMRAHGVALAVTASTGIAATHLGGVTIHSWSGLGIKDHVSHGVLEKIAKQKKIREQIEKTQILIIDEISMISRTFLDNLDTVLQFIRLDRRPFGGVQVIFCGDFFQLPPVSRERLPNTEKFAFMSPTWVAAKLNVCYLTEQFRQTSDDLSNFLNEMRTGEVSDAFVSDLYECIAQTQAATADTVYTRLYTHNADVDQINNESLKNLSTESRTFTAQTKGQKNLVETLKKSVLALDTLELKIGAPVMCIKNQPEQGYFNGTLGTVCDFDSEGFPIIVTKNERTLTIKPEEWRLLDLDGQPVAVYTQIPLRLAWAITVHKSQGMTLDQAEMDLSKTFEPGQGYVALSRVKAWSGLRLLGCNRMALQMDPLVLKADHRFQELSDEAEEKISALNEVQLEQQIAENIQKKGGTMDPFKMEQNRQKITQTKVTIPAPKVSTYLLTKKLVEAKQSLAEMVKNRGMSEDTILKHLQHLRQSDPALNLDYLRPEPKKLAEMIEGFVRAKAVATPDQLDKDDQPRLRLVFELLNEKYFYRELKLAQVFM